jgi:peptide-methionine (R)-S-oxide reductase
MSPRKLLAFVTTLISFQSFAQKEEKMISKTDEQWKAQLTSEQFNITRRKGTERAFTGAY